MLNSVQVRVLSGAVILNGLMGELVDPAVSKTVAARRPDSTSGEATFLALLPELADGADMRMKTQELKSVAEKRPGPSPGEGTIFD